MPDISFFKTMEDYREYYRQYRKKNAEKMRAYQREYNRLWRRKNGYHSEDKWKKANPQKVRAEKILQAAVKSGKIRRRPCAICRKKNAVAHHPNYNDFLKVVFLCHVHHRQFHYEKRRDKGRSVKFAELVVNTNKN